VAAAAYRSGDCLVDERRWSKKTEIGAGRFIE
jgi:hypothetical protein